MPGDGMWFRENSPLNSVTFAGAIRNYRYE